MVKDHYRTFFVEAQTWVKYEVEGRAVLFFFFA